MVLFVQIVSRNALTENAKDDSRDVPKQLREIVILRCVKFTDIENEWTKNSPYSLNCTLCKI